MSEQIQQWLEGRKSGRAISSITIAAYQGGIDRSICPASPRSGSRPAGAVTLDAFYVRLRK